MWLARSWWDTPACRQEDSALRCWAACSGYQPSYAVVSEGVLGVGEIVIMLEERAGIYCRASLVSLERNEKGGVWVERAKRETGLSAG